MYQTKPYEYMVKYTQQKSWIDGRGVFIAFAFFLGGISGGLFMAAAYFNSVLGMFIAICLSALMGFSYMIHLGQPMLFWRMVSKPQTSWISRGFIFIFLYGIFAIITVILAQWFPEATAAITTFKVLAGIFAFAQSIYTGFAVSYVSAIKLWNSAILPILFVICGFSGGMAILLGISLGGSESQLALMENITRITLITFAVILTVYLWNATYNNVSARDAVARMMGGSIAAIFWVGVVVLGVLIPLGISVGTYFSDASSTALIITAVVTEIIGGLALRYVILKAGIYTPLTAGE
ncbi:MAG: polysulfide reductase NrfD [Dehalococcoidales bacterium]|nr:polysulfide reductase NrfD [Dehalococcoidales bacterium]